MFVREVSFGYLFNYYDPEVSVEIMSRIVEMFVDGDCIRSFHIIPVLVHPLIHLLLLHFAHVLMLIAF